MHKISSHDSSESSSAHLVDVILSCHLSLDDYLQTWDNATEVCSWLTFKFRLGETRVDGKFPVFWSLICDPCFFLMEISVNICAWLKGCVHFTFIDMTVISCLTLCVFLFLIIAQIFFFAEQLYLLDNLKSAFITPMWSFFLNIAFYRCILAWYIYNFTFYNIILMINYHLWQNLSSRFCFFMTNNLRDTWRYHVKRGRAHETDVSVLHLLLS